MALDPAKWQINTDKTIQYTGPAHGVSGANYVTVLELHRWLQNLADDASSTGDDYMDITRDDPSNKLYDTIITLKNGYSLINDTTAEYIFGGSIIQGSGGTEVIYDGIQIVANPGTFVEIIQNNALITNDFWNNQPSGAPFLGLNADSANGVSHQFMLKVRNAGADIDGRRFIAITREFNKNYGERKVNGTGRGVNVVALAGGDTDLNNATAAATVATWSTITNTAEGYNAIMVNSSGPYNFYSAWNKDSYTINQLYERAKWLTRRGSGETLYGLNGQLFRGITHEVAYSALSGTFDDSYPVSWGSGDTAGTGQVLADNGSNKMWIQLLTGVAPASGTITQTTPNAASATIGTVTERTVSTPFIGVSTGSALIGAYGVGVEAADLSVNDDLFDLTNTLREPPNQQTFTVGGLVSDEDTVLVAPATGLGSTTIDESQFTLNGALTGAAVTSVVVNGSIPSDTPTTGTIRIKRASGRFTKHAYTSWTGSTFTIGSTNFSTDNAANGANVFISYIDATVTGGGTSLSFAANYLANRNLVVRVRDGGSVNNTPIKEFIAPAVFTSSGGCSVSAIRTSDA